MRGMTQKGYLALLRLHLLWRVGEQDARHILADYEERFAAGMTRGQSEQELSKGFGPPGKLVRALPPDRFSVPKQLHRRLEAVLLQVVLALFCLWWLFRDPPMLASPDQLYPYGILVALLYPFLVWLLVFPSIKDLARVRAQTPLVLAAATVAATVNGLFLDEVYTALRKAYLMAIEPNGYPVETFLAPLRSFAGIVFLALLLVVFFLYRAPVVLFPCLFFISGTLSTLLLYTQCVNWLSEPDELPLSLFSAVSPVLFSVAGGLCVYFWLDRRSREETIPSGMESFLSALRVRLFWRMEAAEVNEILTDYEEFFASGMAEGKTETELCRQFGPPALIAHRLSVGKQRPVILWRLLLAGSLLLGLSVLLIPLLTASQGRFLQLAAQTADWPLSGWPLSGWPLSGWPLIGLVVLFPVLLWFLLGGSLQHPPGWALRRLGRTNRLPWLSCLAVLLCDIALFFAYLLPVRYMARLPDSEGYYWFGIWFTSWHQLGGIYRVLAPVYGLLLLAALLLCLYWFSHARYRIFPCVCVLLGSFASLAQMNDSLLQIVDLDRLPHLLGLSCLPLACGLLLAMVFWLLLRRLGRKGAA